MIDILYVDKLILIIKRYIYVPRCVKDNLSIVSLKNFIKRMYETEKEIAFSNGKLHTHKGIWQELGAALERM